METLGMDIYSGIYQFIQRYYIDSIVNKTGYNPVNTITWAIILVIVVILVYRTLRRYDVSFDWKFAAGNIPFILLGASVRVVEDAGFLQPPVSYFFMTPLIYLVIFLIAFPTLLISLRVRREDYWKHYGSVGLILSIAVLILLFWELQPVNWWIIPVTLLLAALFTIAYNQITARVYSPMNNILSNSIFCSHMVDGFATFLGIQFLGYWELHVLPRFLIDVFGPWVMIPTKVIIFVGILYVLDSMEEDHMKGFVKFVLIVLGLAPGLRDALRMAFQV
ncbi:MAG: DUF63 family protein [Archaeoglobaceae archaeon]